VNKNIVLEYIVGKIEVFRQAGGGRIQSGQSLGFPPSEKRSASSRSNPVAGPTPTAPPFASRFPPDRLEDLEIFVRNYEN
jgi:hypothetical protein